MNTSAHYEVAIVGGGVLGASVGYCLARNGLRVGLFETGTVGGCGATAYSGGIVRAYDPDLALMKLSARGCFLMSNWKQLGFPGDSPLHPTGMVYLLDRNNVAKARKAFSAVDCSRYPVSIHDESPAHLFHPWVGKDHEGVVLHEPFSGYGNARQAAVNLSMGIRAAGCSVFEHCQVSGLNRSENRWFLTVRDRKISCDQLIVAAGASSRKLIPSLPLKVRNISLLQMTNRCPLPVIDEINEVYITPHSDGGCLGGSIQFEEVDELDELPSYGRVNENHTLDRIARLTSNRVVPQTLGGFSGYDAYTGSYRPLVGEYSDSPGLYVLTGASGRGFKYCLAAGESLAQEIAVRFNRASHSEDILPLSDFCQPDCRETVQDLELA